MLGQQQEGSGGPKGSSACPAHPLLKRQRGEGLSACVKFIVKISILIAMFWGHLHGEDDSTSTNPRAWVRSVPGQSVHTPLSYLSCISRFSR